jgi:hypothetical protein
MIEEVTADAAQAIAAPVPSKFHPFDSQNETRPDQRYWSDRGLWSAYQASVFLITLEERNRSRKIIQAHIEQFPAELRGKLFDMIEEI